MNYKVCILAAGKNSKVSYAKDFNIALLPIGTKSALSRIIEKFPRNVEIVIAVGYNSQLIRDFTKIAHNDRKITFVEIENFDTPGSGPGKSLLKCKPYLNCPFIFTSADTIVSEDIPEPAYNWIGVSLVSDSTDYCMADSENDYVIKFYDKIDTPTLLKICKNYKTILNNAFIGLAGIYDYESFFNALEINQDLIKKEHQVSNGLSELIDLKIKTLHFFNWFDTGNEAGYNFANRFFDKNKLLTKPDEHIYFENGKVIKYFADKNKLANRVKRAEKLKNIVPELVDKCENFYSYNFIEGKTLAKTNDVMLFLNFLEFCENSIWKKIPLNDKEIIEFKNLCKKFYYNKTIERLEKFYTENQIKDIPEIINGERTPTIKEMLEKVDWENISNGIPVLFHGDIQPENVIVCDKGFKLIDWRDDFSGNTEYGDIYYDFLKLHHALIVTHEVIRNNQFEIKSNKGYVSIDFMLKNNLLEYKEIFENYLENKGYKLDKLKILTSLTFLNIAPLHHNPYNLFLYYFGKYSLYKELKRKNILK